MKEKEQSSIDLIIGTLKKLELYNFSIVSVCEEAKELHKKEIIEAVTYGNRQDFYDGTETIGEQYYTEKYSTE